jgi:hypothetical protein
LWHERIRGLAFRQPSSHSASPNLPVTAATVTAAAKTMAAATEAVSATKAAATTEAVSAAKPATTTSEAMAAA